MVAYYNEHDPKKAAWLRELIKRGLVADGEVDERSVEDVRPDELMEFTQCHFFAGIGIWSYALGLAGWDDDRPVWTGSCPCQSFSAAGKGSGFADERHLWPAWHHLISQCRPDHVFGEQVGAAIGHGWLDLVHDDLAAEGYTLGSAVLPACSVGAPHIRQRLWFVAHASGAGVRDPRCGGDGSTAGASEEGSRQRQRVRADVGDGGDNLDHPKRAGLEGHGGDQGAGREAGCPRPEAGSVAPAGPTGGVADAEVNRAPGSPQARESDPEGRGGVGHPYGAGPYPGDCAAQATGHGGAVESDGSFWHPSDWLPCRDGKARPVEPGVAPLAHGAPARVVRLRGYGDGIVAPLAAEFVRAAMEVA